MKSPTTNKAVFLPKNIGVPEEEDKRKDHEKILEEIIVENFSRVGKEIVT